MNKFALLSLLLLITLSSCGDDETTEKSQFKVTITNAFDGKENFQSGTMGFIMPIASLCQNSIPNHKHTIACL